MPFFSICIPAYKNYEFLSRLLDSIIIQTFTDYEVIITDDSPDDETAFLINEKYKDYNFQYFKTRFAWDSREWNEGVRRSQGQWIKLMHDDDWFCTEHALQILYNRAATIEGEFIFCSYIQRIPR